MVTTPLVWPSKRAARGFNMNKLMRSIVLVWFVAYGLLVFTSFFVEDLVVDRGNYESPVEQSLDYSHPFRDCCGNICPL